MVTIFINNINKDTNIQTLKQTIKQMNIDKYRVEPFFVWKKGNTINSIKVWKNLLVTNFLNKRYLNFKIDSRRVLLIKLFPIVLGLIISKNKKEYKTPRLIPFMLYCHVDFLFFWLFTCFEWLPQGGKPTKKGGLTVLTLTWGRVSTTRVIV